MLKLPAILILEEVKTVNGIQGLLLIRGKNPCR